MPTTLLASIAAGCFIFALVGEGAMLLSPLRRPAGARAVAIFTGLVALAGLVLMAMAVLGGVAVESRSLGAIGWAALIVSAIAFAGGAALTGWYFRRRRVPMFATLAEAAVGLVAVVLVVASMWAPAPLAAGLDASAGAASDHPNAPGD